MKLRKKMNIVEGWHEKKDEYCWRVSFNNMAVCCSKVKIMKLRKKNEYCCRVSWKKN